jgi:hypothetical protein
MMSEFHVFAVCVTLGFLGSFGGAHLLADLLAPAHQQVFDVTLVLLGALDMPGR